MSSSICAPSEVSVIDRGHNIVITFYGLLAAISAGIAAHKWSVFLFVGFVLAYVLKLANSVARKQGIVEGG
jgi:hypothetical protein